MNEKQKEEYFDLDFFSSFTDGMDGQNRYAVTVISSVCKEMIDSSERNNSPEFIIECARKIYYQCTQTMKFSEMYKVVTNLRSDNDDKEEASIDAGKFISNYIKKCSKYIKEDVCELNLNNSLDGVCITFNNIFTDKDILEYVITTSLRKMIINGARKIEINAYSTNNEIVISMKTIKAEAPVPAELMSEVVSLTLFDNIIKASEERLDSRFDIRDDEAELRIPIREVTFLGQPLKDDDGYFNIFNNLLSDLEMLTSYTKDNKK